MGRLSSLLCTVGRLWYFSPGLPHVHYVCLRLRFAWKPFSVLLKTRVVVVLGETLYIKVFFIFVLGVCVLFWIISLEFPQVRLMGKVNEPHSVLQALNAFQADCAQQWAEVLGC